MKKSECLWSCCCDAFKIVNERYAVVKFKTKSLQTKLGKRETEHYIMPTRAEQGQNVSPQ